LHCNCSCISYHLCDKASYWLKIATFHLHLTPLLGGPRHLHLAPLFGGPRHLHLTPLLGGPRHLHLTPLLGGPRRNNAVLFGREKLE